MVHRARHAFSRRRPEPRGQRAAHGRGLLHAVANRKTRLLGLDDRNWNIGPAVQNEVGTLRATFGIGIVNACRKLAPHHDATVGEIHFLAELMLLPARLHDGWRDELGADVAFAEGLLVHATRTNADARSVSSRAILPKWFML